MLDLLLTAHAYDLGRFTSEFLYTTYDGLALGQLIVGAWARRNPGEVLEPRIARAIHWAL